MIKEKYPYLIGEELFKAARDKGLFERGDTHYYYNNRPVMVWRADGTSYNPAELEGEQ